MKGRPPLRLTARGEALRDYAEAAAALGAIAVGISSFFFALKLIGY